MKTNIILLALAGLCLTSCRDQAEEERQKQIKALEAIDEQHDKAMRDATKGEFPEPKPAGPLRY